ncbi:MULTISPECIES: DUF6660 family protein [unclassified Flavobacterium]|uniref:DUF6660 family protein n=1 Tax=Flavobacterium sp. ZE23DGlu08 TaxID=3059026 RepID=UPI000C3FB5F5|nr:MULTISPECIES: DUF6660 family protein [unclassified Flavobacterium]PIF62828.1 hypothetical protein CLV00_2489 [Flavobacterium sp. 11]WKL44312.1 hypothetical protein Q1W72_01500 [Flavobacterium sp. ZE23DGlu08]
MSIIIVVLSCMPCADKEQGVSSEKVTITNSSKQHQEKEACSPLCVCNCCGCQGFAYNSTMFNFNFIAVKNIIDKKLPNYKSILTSNFFGSIWQPPQINA